MVKTHEKSFFTMLSLDRLIGDNKLKFGEKEITILQIAEKGSYTGNYDYPVHICEVVYTEDLKKKEKSIDELVLKIVNEMEGKTTK